MTNFNLENLKHRIPLVAISLIVIAVLFTTWFLLNNLVVFLAPKIPRPVIATSLNQDLIAADVVANSVVGSFNNFNKAIYYKKTSAKMPSPEILASKLGFNNQFTKDGDVYVWSKVDESLRINIKSSYLEYSFDTTKNSVFFTTGDKPGLEKAKIEFANLLAQMKLTNSFINPNKPVVTYSQGLQGLSEINPKAVVIAPSDVTIISLNYPYTLNSIPLLRDYPETVNASAQYSLNNRLIYLKLPLLQDNWQEDTSYDPLTAGEILNGIRRKEATLVSYNYTATKFGLTKEQLKNVTLKKITAGLLVNQDSLMPVYLLEADCLTVSGFAVSGVFYLPAISAKFFQQ